MVIFPSPFLSPASQLEASAFPSAMFTKVRISSIVTSPELLQSPTHGGVGVDVVVGVALGVGAAVAVGVGS